MKKHLTPLILLMIFSTSSEASNFSPPFGISCKEDPYPSKLVETSGLYHRVIGPEAKEALIRFKTKDGHTLNAYTYRATEFSDSDGPIVFVIHGAARNADDYLRRFKAMAEQNDALVVAPEFPKLIYGPGSDRFTLAVGKKKPPYTGIYRAKEWRLHDDYLYSEIEHLFEAIRRELKSDECTYRIWGHSAGGQFVHRLMTFRPDARVASAVSVNAGFYTLPAYGNGSNPNYFMPYGLQGTPLKLHDVQQLLQAPLTIMVGEFDTKTGKESSTVRDSSAANNQGPNRRQRAEFYYQTGKQEAHRLGLNFGWRFAVVPGSGHSSRRVGPSAAWFLFNLPDAFPCVTTPAEEAAGLVINEIHGDPAGGIAGDANNDGYRDPQDDEFVELLNTSDSDICLDGWYLTDASNSSRHRFPLGSLLPAGKVLVVFGGGVPTGQFGIAKIQTAVSAGELGLSNKGDVLTLSDAQGNLHQRISWGNCNSKQCAQEHISHAIDINQSLNRWPEGSGSFLPHRHILDGGRYSPGTKVDGGSFD